MQADISLCIRKIHSFLRQNILGGHLDFPQEFSHLKVIALALVAASQPPRAGCGVVRVPAGALPEVSGVPCSPFRSSLKSCLQSWKANSQCKEARFSIWIYWPYLKAQARRTPSVIYTAAAMSLQQLAPQQNQGEKCLEVLQSSLIMGLVFENCVILTSSNPSPTRVAM